MPTHQQVTDESARTIRATVGGMSLGFSDKAIAALSDSNADVDSIMSGSAALFHPERHFTNERLGEASALLIANKAEIVSLVKAELPDGDKARDVLGRTLHTIQDFYSHSNWVEREGGIVNTALGQSELGNPAALPQNCPADPNMLGPDGGGALTSAYYVGILGCSTLPVAGKCYHGNYTTSCIGINKDLPPAVAAEHGVPGSPFHGAARAAALASTTEFLNAVITALDGDEVAISALLDVKGSLGFVVDTTGSMASIQSGVRAIASGLVTAANSPPFTRPDRWIVEGFNDPDVGAAVVTRDASVAQAAIGALGAGGGGDCPEMSQQGILEALRYATPNSRLFVFTDASAKDGNLINDVISTAQKKKTAITYLISGNCSEELRGAGETGGQLFFVDRSRVGTTLPPVDPAYLRGALETGGQFFFVDRSQVGMTLPLIMPQLTGDLVTIVSNRGVLTAGSPVSTAFPVDSSIRQLSVSVGTVSTNGVELLRPNGAVVDPTDPDATIVGLTESTFITIKAPARGSWRLRLTGSGDFALSASGNSPLALHAFDFVAANTDIHGGYFPIAGQPVAASRVTGLARLIGPYASAAFQLVDDVGTPLQAVEMTNNEVKVGPHQFLGTFVLPERPFRLLVTGLDAEAQPYQRQLPVLYSGKNTRVEISGGNAVFLPAGLPLQLDFVVTNHGDAGTFAITARDNAGFIEQVAPATVALTRGQLANVKVTLLAPASTPNNTTDLLAVTATRQGNTADFNSAAVAVSTVAQSIDGDLNADGVVDCSDLQIVKLAFGKKTGQIGFDSRADVDRNSIVNIRDLSYVSKKLANGTKCF